MKAPTGERWVHEIKHSAFRIIARRVGRNVRLFTKQGVDFSKRYPLVVEAINRLRVSSIVLDGEVVCIGSDGLPDFDALWNRTNDAAVLFFAFDRLALDDEDFRPKPLLDRKQRLAKLTKDKTGIRYVEHLEGDGPTIFEHACKLGLEGIVSKRVDLPYESGPSKDWQKVKNKEHPAMVRVREALDENGKGDGLRVSCGACPRCLPPVHLCLSGPPAVLGATPFRGLRSRLKSLWTRRPGGLLGKPTAAQRTMPEDVP